MIKNLYTKTFIRESLNTLSVFLCFLFSLFSYAQIYTTGEATLYVSEDATITQKPIIPTKLFVTSGTTIVGEEYTNASIVNTPTSTQPVEKKSLALKKPVTKHSVKTKKEVRKAISYNHLVFSENNTKQVFTKDPRNVCVVAASTYYNKQTAVLSKISKVFDLEILDNRKNTIAYVNNKIAKVLLLVYRVRPPPFYLKLFCYKGF